VFFGNKNNCPVGHKSEECEANACKSIDCKANDCKANDCKANDCKANACKANAFESFCNKLAQEHGLTKLIFQKQVHGTNGVYIDFKEMAEYIKSFEFEADFLVTNQKNIGIGILTADCLPIILYDTNNHVAACIHAGWRSSIAEICAHALQMMFSKFKFTPEDIQIYFGPCAKTCCYEVQSEFLDNLKNFKFKSQVIRKAGNKLFFDNVLFNKLLLIDLGLLSKNMNFENNHCTMCTDKSGTDKSVQDAPGTGTPGAYTYHSYRRDGDKALRQISFIGLK
jgi:YfiH family protein